MFRNRTIGIEEKIMNKKFILLCSLVVLYTFTASNTFATSNCKQSFTFLRMSPETNPTFWITEKLTGECGSNYLLRVAISDPNTSLTSTEIELDVDCPRVKEVMRYSIATEEPVEFEEKEGVWKSEKNDWYIKAPDSNPKLMVDFAKHIVDGGDNGITWNNEQKSRGILIPGIHNANARTLYFYPKGLYINYVISKVYYFPASRYILIFTNQDHLAVGLDTMHGFFLLIREK